MNLPKYHLIKVTVEADHPRGTMITLSSREFYMQGTKTLYYNYIETVEQQVEKYLTDLGFDLVGWAKDSPGYILISTTFKAVQ